MEKINTEDLIKKIEEKIEQLEKQENPNELLKKALLKKKIISNMDEISEEQINNLFEIIHKEMNK